MRLKAPAKPFALMIFFILLTLIAVPTVIVVNQTPLQQTTTQTEGSYTATANYNYTATLNPNTIYPNQTTLKPGQGILYAKLTKQIDLTLTYTFEATFPTTTTTIYNITRTLKTTAWDYQMSATSTQTTNQQTLQINLPTYDRNEIEAVKARIDNETGTQTSTYSTTTSSYYTLEITPTFITTATSPQGPITQIFTPTLSIDYNRDQQGDVISLTNLEQTQSNQLTQTQITSNTQTERYASYVLIVVALTGLTLTILFYQRQKTTQPKQHVNKIMQSHKDLIIEATKNSNKIDTLATVDLATEDDLIKTAEILAKPIIHAKNENQKDIFYIIDEFIKYQYLDNSS
jgi:hypothetical protein